MKFLILLTGIITLTSYVVSTEDKSALTMKAWLTSYVTSESPLENLYLHDNFDKLILFCDCDFRHCGKHLLVKPEQLPHHEQSGKCKNLPWSKYMVTNKKLCQCKRFGPPNLKYIYLFGILYYLEPEKVFIDPGRGIYHAFYNQTRHIIVDTTKSCTYYEYKDKRNGEIGHTFFDNLDKIDNEIKDKESRLCANFMSVLLETMRMEKISITLINRENSFWEKHVSSLIDGVGGFIIDPSLPSSPEKDLPMEFSAD